MEVALVVAGLGALVAANEDVLSAIALTGAAYLLGLGVSALRRPTSITADVAPVGSGCAAVFRARPSAA